MSPNPAAVRVAGAWIVGVGGLKPRPGDTVVDGGGMGLAPGFIDIHSHAARDLRAGSDALGASSQGITTLIVGNDGNSEFPLDLFLQRVSRGSPVNVGSFVGHTTLRTRAMGVDQQRPARSDEIGKMQLLLEEELAAGGFGLSTDVRLRPAKPCIERRARSGCSWRGRLRFEAPRRQQRVLEIGGSNSWRSRAATAWSRTFHNCISGRPRAATRGFSPTGSIA